MSSAPSYSHLQSPSGQLGKRTHKHRRSGAISGNFDAVGLGLFSPPPPISHAARHSPHSLNPIPQAAAAGNHQHLLLSLTMLNSKSDSDVLDWHYNFCNEEDFSNKPTDADFEFPSKSPNSPILPFCSPKVVISQRRASGSSLMLNSPIRLRNKKSASSMNATPRLYLTDETILDEHNIPDALIDLDEILNPNNALMGDRTESLIGAEPRSFHDTLDEAGLLPHSRSHAQQPYSFSPYSSPAYFKQSIREPADRAIVEECDIEETSLDISAEQNCSLPSISIASENLPLLSAPALLSGPVTASTASELYELSVNSSNTSLPSIEISSSQRNASATLLEKSVSNSSRDSAFSGLVFVRSNSIKRGSGAKASRYQTFYDQSLKISYALKNSSAENVNTNSSGTMSHSQSAYESLLQPNSGHSCNVHSQHEGLGHCSSMPCLRVPAAGNMRALSNLAAGSNLDTTRARDPYKPGVHVVHNQCGISARLQDLRNTFANVLQVEGSYRMSSKLSSSVETVSPVDCLKAKDFEGKKSLSAESFSKVTFDDHLQSPPSVYSGAESTVSTPADHGTDHSSLVSQPEVMSSFNKLDRGISRSVTPVLEGTTGTKSNIALSTPKSKIVKGKSSGILNNDLQTGYDASTSSLQRYISPRTESPSQTLVLQATKIPPFSPTKRSLKPSKSLDKLREPKDTDKNKNGFNEKKSKEHKRTGSGHRLLSYWFRKCA